MGSKETEFWKDRLEKVWEKRGDIGTHILHLEMQKVKLEKLNLTNIWKIGFSSIGHFSYSSWYILPEEEVYALGVYGDRNPEIKEFPLWQIVALNPNSMIFEQRPIDKNIYPTGANIWKSKEVEHDEIIFSTPLDIQQLMGLICVVNVVLPWDHSKSEKTFQIQEILLGATEESLGFKAKNYQTMALSSE